MWKKDRNILFFTVGLLVLVMVFAWAAGKCRFSAWMSGHAGSGAAVMTMGNAVVTGTEQPQPELVKKGKVALTFDDGPSGTYTPQLLDGSWDKTFEEELNMFPVLWTIDPLDWCTDSASCVVGKVVPKVKENSIILLHDEYASTVTAALQIVDELQRQGYEFVTVEEILFD